ncbi:MAG: STAS domain-containing protein [Anaerohalosphaeraceae bacterium]
MDQKSPNMTVEYVGQDVIVATLVDEKILEESQIQALESSFLPLIEENQPIKLVVDFSQVRFLTSSVLGLLIRLSKKIYEAEGILRLCGIQPKIYEIFKITRLDKVFDIYPTRQEALEGLV